MDEEVDDEVDEEVDEEAAPAWKEEVVVGLTTEWWCGSSCRLASGGCGSVEP